MAWEVEFTDDFDDWWQSLTNEAQDAVDRIVGLLEARGPVLGSPHTSDVKGSRHGQLRELRVQVQGRPIRAFYAFDPRRVAILLIAGDKTGDDRFYERMVPKADELYDDHLNALRREGVIGDGS